MKISVLLFACILCYVTVCNAQVIRGDYAIQNVQTGLLLRIKDANSKNGTPIVAYEPQNWKCMTWSFRQVDNNTYQLINLFSNKTFEPQKNPVTQTITLSEQMPAEGLAQQYEFINAGDNAYFIKAKGTDLYITSPAAKTEINANIILAPKNNSDTQRWKMYPQSPTM